MGNGTHERIAGRLKANGLVPRKGLVQLVIWRGPSARVKWEAVDPVTHRSYLTGGTAGITVMVHTEWIISREEDGWTILSPGDPLPNSPLGGYMMEIRRKNSTRIRDLREKN